MDRKTTNYYNTFIEVAEDCPVQSAEVPPQKGDIETIAGMQFRMLYDHPYQYTSDEVLFAIHAQKNCISKRDWAEAEAAYFSKGQACFRSSPLPKRYGWGVHSNAEGKLAIYAVDSEEYKKLSADKSLKHLKAMRSKRAS